MYLKKLNKNFLLATFSNCFFFVNFSCFFLLPLFLDNLGYTKTLIGLTMSSFGISSILLTPFCSSLIDRYGKKLLSLIALFLMIISSLSFIYFDNFFVIICLRIIQGAAFSIFFNASSAIASNNLDDEDKQYGLSFFSSFTIFSYFLGPFFSEKLITSYGFEEFFVYSSIFSVLAFLLIMNLDENPSASKVQIKVSSFFKIIRDEKIFDILFANFLVASGFGVVMNFVSLYLVGKGLSVGYFFAGYAIIVSLSRIFLSSYIRQSNLFPKVLLMLLLFSLTIFFIPAINSLIGVMAFSILFPATYSLIYPILSSILMIGRDHSISGRLFGALNASFSIGVNLMTLFYGLIADLYSFESMFRFASLLIIAGVVLILIQRR